MGELDAIVRHLDRELRNAEIPDYDSALNGLQLANAGAVRRVAAAVDYSAASVAGAIREGADLLIVHHGMFWRGTQRIVGVAYDRLHSALSSGLAVYSSHIPLDLHPRMGNNVLLAREFGLVPAATFGRYKDVEIGVMGESDVETAELLARVRAFAARFDTTLANAAVAPGRRTRRWAIVSGMGASSASLAEARERGVDTLITGEGTHHTAVEALEHGIMVAYAGHYATETPGVQALAKDVSARFGLPWSFVNVPTGL